MVENLGFTNRRKREEIETKEKMQALSQGSWQLLHAPCSMLHALFVSLIRVSISNLHLSSSPTPKEGKPP